MSARSGGPGPSPARGSHRSGRARLAHPAPQVMGSLRNGDHSVLHPLPRYPVELRGDALGGRCLRHLSLHRVHDPALPSLPGVRSGTFPRFHGTMECSDSCSPIPPRFVAFTRWYRAATRLARRGTASGRSSIPGLFHRGPTRSVGVETSRSPRFLGNPPVCMPRSSTPASSARQARTFSVSTRPSVFLTTSALARVVCRGSITRPAHSLCTLRRADHSATTQHSVPAGGHPLPGGLGDPLGSAKGFRDVIIGLHLFPLLQASPGALGRTTLRSARPPPISLLRPGPCPAPQLARQAV